MEDFSKTLEKFVMQSQFNDLKTSSYPKAWGDLRLRISFGMGAPARVPWIAFITPEMEVSRGFYPVYLYYKAENILILAYGISETENYGETWPIEVQNSSKTIESFFDKKIPRYGDSFIFKIYKVEFGNDFCVLKYEDGKVAEAKDLNADLDTILGYYNKSVSRKIQDESSPISQGLFYMEKQLEDFIIFNWENTDLGKKYDLIVEEGVLLSQQYRTEIGPIDILARDKISKDYVVIELKRNQTSDDTIGQLARYMGWIRETKGGNVKGVIIAGSYDKKLDFALKAMTGVEVFLYQVDFKLNQFVK